MNVVVEEIVSEFPVEVTEVVVVVEVSDAVSFLELTDVADNTYTGKDGYVPTVNESTGKLELKEPTGGGGGGSVSSVFGRTGAVTAQNGDYNADQITETTGKVFVSPTEKANIAHANRSILDQITEAFTTALKNAYDGAVTWISTNGANVVSHISNTSNPHNVTKSQVGLGNVQNVDTTTTSNVTEGSRLYFTTARVLATVLSGLSVASGGAIVDTDTILVAFGKLQNQINAVPGLITSALASFKTANFLDATSSIQGQLNVKVDVLINDNVDSSTITGTVVNTIIKSYLVPANTLAVGDTIDFKSVCSKTNGGTPANCNFRLYTNTSNSLTGASSLALVVPASNNIYFSLDRTYTLKSGNTLESFPVGSTATTDEVGSTAAISNTAFNPTVDNYFIIAIQPNNASDSFKQTLCYITHLKSKTTI